MTRTWPEDWDARKQGAGCWFCGNQLGQPFYAGSVGDAHLERHAIARGHAIVIFRERHVADFTSLTTSEAAAYWHDVHSVARDDRAGVRAVPHELPVARKSGAAPARPPGAAVPRRSCSRKTAALGAETACRIGVRPAGPAADGSRPDVGRCSRAGTAQRTRRSMRALLVGGFREAEHRGIRSVVRRAGSAKRTRHGDRRERTPLRHAPRDVIGQLRAAGGSMQSPHVDAVRPTRAVWPTARPRARSDRPREPAAV